MSYRMSIRRNRNSMLQGLKQKPNDARIRPHEIFVDTGIIMCSDKETIQLFMNLAATGNDAEYMRAYKELFADWANDIEPYLPYQGYLFYSHFIKDYNELSVEELVEKYKDSRYLEGEDHGKVYSRFKKHEQ